MGKTNDRSSNLQILTVGENNRKSIIERGLTSKPIKLKCPQYAVGSLNDRRKELVID